jgi:hypothetical protein
VAGRPHPTRNLDRDPRRREPDRQIIEICRDNLRRILDHEYARQLPLGINVEGVSINRDEIDASIDLFRALERVVRERFGERG